MGWGAYGNSMRFLATTLLLGLVIGATLSAYADDVPTPGVTAGQTRATYSATSRLRRRRTESVLTSPRSAVKDTPGTGWLLHSGPPERDPCDSPDATSGLRMMCLGW